MCRATNNVIPKTFKVTEDEVDRMISVLNANKILRVEVRHLSRTWIRSIMSQPRRKNKSQRRSFEYSQNKIENYLQWRVDANITKMVETCFEDAEGKYFSEYLGGSFAYWNGTDKDGSPILWVHPENFPWDKFDSKKIIDFGAVFLQGFFEALPPHVSDVNFVLLLDRCPYSQILRHPKIIPSLINLWMKCAPDRLRKAVMVTGVVGRIFYQTLKNLAPSSLVDKVTTVSSREEAAQVMLDCGQLESEKDIPDFLGGNANHMENEENTRNFPSKMKQYKSHWPEMSI